MPANTECLPMPLSRIRLYGLELPSECGYADEGPADNRVRLSYAKTISRAAGNADSATAESLVGVHSGSACISSSYREIFGCSSLSSQRYARVDAAP